MRVAADDNSGANFAGQSYDEIYIESWKATLEECKKKLEPSDHQRALEIKTLEDFRLELDKLQKEYREDAPKHVIMLLYPTLDHYDQFTQSFVKMMAQAVETSMLWGLLYLVVKLSFESKGTIVRITKMLEKIGQELRRMNGCSASISDVAQIKGDTVEINREIIVLWLNVIMVFRTQVFDQGPELALTWQSLTSMYDEAMRNIGDAVVRIEKVAELAERQSRIMDLEEFQRVLSLNKKTQVAGQLPCHVLPVAKNKSFFGRGEELRHIEERLHPANISDGLKSLAIYGLGGIGKTQTALAYAYSKVDELDVVLWVPAENEIVLQQGFSQIAVNGLKLPNAQPSAHHENMILVMSWLQQTSAKWLLVFDNVESHEILNGCWPASKHGSVLITTRKRVVASQPIEFGYEINSFTVEQGAQFLLHLLSNRAQNRTEAKAASELSDKLNGHALAISQMAAYMNARTMSITAFLVLYEKYPKRLHRERKAGWKYIGYNHGLDTVWDISFGGLGKSAAACLGILSFLVPDAIPDVLLEPPITVTLHDSLKFCQDELERWDTIEQLTGDALVKHDPNERFLSLHRLVQAECLFRMTENDRQDSFDGAVRLLLEVFPDRGDLVSSDDRWEEGDKYLGHIASLARSWNDSQEKPEPLKPTTDLCNLMANASWLVADNDTAGILSLVTHTAEAAYKKLPEADSKPILWADILNLLGILYLMEGDFKTAEEKQMKSLEVRRELNSSEDLSINACYNYLGVITDSDLRHDEAKEWLAKSAEILAKGDGDLYIRLRCQNKLNTSRNRYATEKFDESEKLVDEALVLATHFNSWYSLAYVHETYASLYSRSGNLDRAHTHVVQAEEVLAQEGTFATMSWISGLCSFRAASVAILQDRRQYAIEAAERSVAINKLYKAPIGVRARSVHLLSKAFSKDPDRQADSEEARREAQRLRSLLPKGRTDLGDESDMAYEKLVTMIQR